MCVQVKRWRNKVQRCSIAELRGSLRPHQTGLFVTTSDFSKPAIEEANDNYKAPISLINGREFVDILCEYGIGVTAEEVVIYELDQSNKLLDMPFSPDIDKNGIEIFADHKGQRHFAVFFSPTKILFDNEMFRSPSAAGTKIQNGCPVNGWKFWKYVDIKTGKTCSIDQLRKGLRNGGQCIL